MSMKNEEEDLYPIIQIVGENIRKIRKLQGLTQDELAKKSGVKDTYITGIETGKRNSSLKTIAKILDALEVKPEELFNTNDIINTLRADKRTSAELVKKLLLDREFEEIALIQKLTQEILNAFDNIKKRESTIDSSFEEDKED